ncbi:MAG TPA: hypothetical protein VMC79_11930 [Rectinemataceae bacterium]|nr:hypothetical protein [Rectinemataceae bacterium]
MASTIVDSVICSQCGEREADVFIRRRVGDGVPTAGPAGIADLALCESCARGRGMVVGDGRLELSLGEILHSAIEDKPTEGFPVSGPPRCSVCGMEYATLIRERRLGCAACAGNFRTQLRRLIPPLVLNGATVNETPALKPSADRGSAQLFEASPPAQEALRGAPELTPLFRYPAFAYPPPETDPTGSGADVVIATKVTLSRNIAGWPFLAASAQIIPSLRVILAGLFDGDSGFDLLRLTALPQSWRRALSERAFVSRSFSSDPEAVLAASRAQPVYVVVGDGEHLRIVSRVPGFDSIRALGLAQACADHLSSRLPPGTDFARDEEFGWLCARADDCGTALSLSAVLHLPALVLAGLHERYIKSVLAEGASVRGLYGIDTEGASPSIFEIELGPADGRPGRSAADLLDSCVRAGIEAERRARTGLAATRRDSLADMVGRAFGVLRYARRIDAAEGLQVISRLRLGSLLGLAAGADGAALDALLEEVGPGSLAAAMGLDSLPERGQEEVMRVVRLRGALTGLHLVEGGS